MNKKLQIAALSGIVVAGTIQGIGQTNPPIYIAFHWYMYQSIY